MIIRISSALILVALALLINMVLDPTGSTAIPFSFIGIPAVALGILCYFIAALLARGNNSPDTEN